MTFIAIIVAATAAWIWGAIWYSLIGKRWVKASGLNEADIDRGNPVPYIVSFICTVLVAAVLQHMLYQIDAIGPDGFFVGLTLGLFVATPWMVTNIFFGQRSKSLIWMDGLYPPVGMALMGVVLGLMT